MRLMVSSTIIFLAFMMVFGILLHSENLPYWKIYQSEAVSSLLEFHQIREDLYAGDVDSALTKINKNIEYRISVLKLIEDQYESSERVKNALGIVGENGKKNE